MWAAVYNDDVRGRSIALGFEIHFLEFAKMRKTFASIVLCPLLFCVAVGCTPKTEDGVDVSLDQYSVEDGESDNMTSNSMTPGGNMTSKSMTPGGNMTSTADTP